MYYAVSFPRAVSIKRLTMSQGFQSEESQNPDQDQKLADYKASTHDDPAQAAFMEERLILVNEQDQPTGSATKFTAHQAPGLLHRAFSVLLFDEQNRLLLQKRSQHKITFPGYWANSCCSHPLNISEELETENNLGIKRAALRKMHQELGIPRQSLAPENILLMCKVHYRSVFDQNWIEEELDSILLIKASVTLNINPNEIETCSWVNQEQLLELLNSGVRIAPWFRWIAEQLLPLWWPILDQPEKLTALCNNQIHRAD